MKHLILLSILFVSGSVWSQSKLSVGMMGSIDVCAQTQSIMGGNMPSVGYHTGIRGRYQFTKVFAMQTGISFVSHRLASGKQEAVQTGGQPIIAPVADDLKAFEVKQQIQQLQIPVLGSLYVGEKWRVGITTGFSYNHTLKMNQEVIRYYQSHTETEHTTWDSRRGSRESIWGSFGAGVEYQTQRLSFRMEPMANYQLIGWNKQPYQKLYPLWSVGLNMTVFYHF